MFVVPADHRGRDSGAAREVHRGTLVRSGLARAAADTASGCVRRPFDSRYIQTYNEQYCHVLVEYPSVLVQQHVHDVVEI